METQPAKEVSDDLVIFETERLLFRHHIPEDLVPFLEMESDAEYRGSQQVHPRDVNEKAFYDCWLPRKPELPFRLYATVYKPDQKYIGRIGIYPPRDDDGKVILDEGVLAFYIARPYWNLGLASEAGQAFVKRGFEVHNLKRITAGTGVNNIGSNRAIVKSGLIYSHSGGFENGGTGWHDYVLVNPNWKPQDSPVSLATKDDVK